MNKNALYLVVALALGVTAATFFLSKTDAARTCSDEAIVVGTENAIGPTSTVGSPPTKAVVRGFPMWYYQEPFPAGCVSANGSGSTGAFSVGNLGDDFLIWLIISLVLFLANFAIKALRGPTMLGDKKGGRRV